MRLAPGTLPNAIALDAVPFFPQEDLQCGPAALASALSWSGVPVTPEELRPQVYTPARRGTLELALVAAARERGRLVYRVSQPRDLLAELAAGHPVVVLQNLGLGVYPVWHWAVAIGFELEQDGLLLRSGRQARRWQSLGLFDHTWARGGRVGLLVLAPDELPATAREREFAEAAAGLEQANAPEAAARAYRAALARWPDSYVVHMGLGNSLFASGDLAGAADAFAEAARVHPRQGAAHNNLAHTLLALGRPHAALAPARRAVGLGGPDAELYRATLREIERQLP